MAYDTFVDGMVAEIDVILVSNKYYRTQKCQQSTSTLPNPMQI